MTSRATATGRNRVRDPTSSGFTPPNNQATGSTRFSYAAALEGGEQVELVSLDGTALTKEDPKLLGEAVNKWTLAALAKKEYHNVPEAKSTIQLEKFPSVDTVVHTWQVILV